jgi:hypothetical protein
MQTDDRAIVSVEVRKTGRRPVRKEVPMPGSVVTALFRKKSAELSRGSYSRGAKVWPPNRSRYNRKPEDAPCDVGMGIVQALLAALSGHVDQFSWGGGGLVGTIHLYSTSSRGDYHFTWDEREPDLALFGGFANGPTYHLAILHLVLCYLDQYHGGSERSTELMECWFTLVAAMQRLYQRGANRGRGWSVETVGEACRNANVRPHIEHAADSMWFSMRYALPDLSLGRAQDLYPDQVLDLPLVEPEGTLAGSALFSPPSPPRRRFAAAQPARPELELKLAQMPGLVAAREERIVGAMPVWHFPEPGD